MQFIESFTNIATNFFSNLEKNINTEFLSNILDKLFIELKNGNSYLELNQKEINQFKQYKNIIKYDQLSPLVIVNKNKLSIGKIWYMEKKISNFLISKAIYNVKINDINNLNQNILNQFDLILITGAPGTGKTFNAANILNILLNNCPDNFKISISAPTGKAATNLYQSLIKQSINKPNLKKLNNIKDQGQTLHKLLNINHYSLKYNQQENNITPDLIIIDEASMIDIDSMYKLIQLINDKKTKLILLGDPNQLPPIGYSDLFSIIIKSNILKNNTINLTKNYRYKENSGIEQLANLCLEQHPKEQIINCFTQYNKTLQIIQDFNINSLILKCYQNHKNYWDSIKNNDKTNAFKFLTKQIILCVLKKDADEFNTSYINLVKLKLNILSSKDLFTGIAIIITKNNYNLNLYNGDIGIIFEENKKLYVYFNVYANEFKKFNINELTNYDLAFSLTVHKSQGCEYDHVTLIEPSYNNKEQEIDIFDRKMIYTAITRAKESFTYLGNKNNFIKALSKINIKKSIIQLFLDANQKNI